VIGDKSQSPNVRNVETNLATLKRFRSHPRGREMPIFYLMRWPDKDHVLNVAQLGANDILGMPVRPSLLEKRLKAFMRRTLATPSARKTA
jgi:DNA-binding response OmpR family regulator